jgi:hypothetical protein
MAAGFDDFSFCAVSGSDLPLDSAKPSSVSPVHFIRQSAYLHHGRLPTEGWPDASIIEKG